MLEGAEKIIEVKAKESKESLSEQSKELIEKRREAHLKEMKSGRKEDKKNYILLDKLVKKQVKKDKEIWIENKAEKMEEASKKGDQKTLFSVANELTGTKRAPPSTIKSKTGEIIENSNERQKRWIQHFSEMLNKESPSERAKVGEKTKPQLDIQLHEPTLKEVEIALKALKNGKAPGIDQVQAEMLKKGGIAVANQLHSI